jgi:hypothetical protein
LELQADQSKCLARECRRRRRFEYSLWLHRPNTRSFKGVMSQAIDSRKTMVEQSKFDEELSEREDRLPL